MIICVTGELIDSYVRGAYEIAKVCKHLIKMIESIKKKGKDRVLYVYKFFIKGEN